MTSINILLVEDHKLMRVGLKSLFEELEGLEVVSEAQTGKEAIEKYKIVHPDVILMDIGLPDISGIEATKKILELNGNAKVIMLTSHISEQEVLDSLHAGACAYVMKDINIEVLILSLIVLFLYSYLLLLYFLFSFFFIL